LIFNDYKITGLFLLRLGVDVDPAPLAMLQNLPFRPVGNFLHQAAGDQPHRQLEKLKERVE
jgi:hypothetical protein